MATGTKLSTIKAKLPGKVLTKDNNGIWQETEFLEVATELGRTDVQESRILSIESTYYRKIRLNLLEEDSKKESFEVFADDDTCSSKMINVYEFPGYLFSKSWSKSNGFAGLKDLKNGNVSWFRLLVKMINGHKDYYWHEMTFLIHQSSGQGRHITVVCFEVPDDKVDSNDSTNPSDSECEIEPHNFLKELKVELDNAPPHHIVDWRYVQSLLLRQAIVVVDRGVWACSKAVRKIEKNRDRTNSNKYRPFDFSGAHNLLRHTLHSTEILQVASQTLTFWVDQYSTSQKLQCRIKHDQEQQNSLVSNPQHHRLSYADDTPLPTECYHADLLATLQLLSNLMHRSASNDARLRNEISLAFNLVNQQDTKTMRTISIVTLLFLPATFVSTLFSMSFFDYDGGSGRWNISEWIWLYFVIAGVLTVLTFIAWFRSRIGERLLTLRH